MGIGPAHNGQRGPDMAKFNGVTLRPPRWIEISTCYEDRRVVPWAEFANDNAHDPDMVRDVAYWLTVQCIAHIGGGAAPLFRIKRA